MGKYARKSGRKLGESGFKWKNRAGPDLRGRFLWGKKRSKVMVTCETHLALRPRAGMGMSGFVKKTALAGKFPRGYTRGSS